MNQFKEMYNLNKEDILIIKEFITMYEEIEQKYKEYCILCDSIRKNIIYQNNKEENLSLEENCRQIENKLLEIKTNTNDEYRKHLLQKQIENLKSQVEQIKIYVPIEKIYSEMYYGNIQNYFTQEQEEEKATIKYNIKDELQEKDYYYNKRSTITQIYIRLKYLNDYYEKRSRDEKIQMDTEFLKNNLKFYNLFKSAVIKYTKENKEIIENIINNIQNKDNIKEEHIQRIK